MKWFNGIWHTVLGKIAVITAVVGLIVGTAVATPPLIQLVTGNVSTTSQNVIIFVGGMNSTNVQGNKNICKVAGTFDSLVGDLKKYVHITNPYDNGCPATTNMKNQSVSMAFFSYRGGKIDPTTDAWKPNPYTACDPDTIPLKDDVTTFVNMLTAYHAAYPNAHFTIVAHSLGGLVALEGAAQFEKSFDPTNNPIYKLITADSPLHGVANIAIAYPGGCRIQVGPIVRDLGQLATTPQLADKLVEQLENNGTSVYTLGNGDDCLYFSVVCVGGTVSLNSVQTQFVKEAYAHTYALFDGRGFAAGHGAIFNAHFSPNNQGPLFDIMRYILAPHVSITSPQPGTMIRAGVDGAPMAFSATVRCDWGTALQATARLVVSEHAPYFVGTSVIDHNNASILTLSGMVNLPASLANNAEGTFSIGSTNSCAYPKNVSSSVRPTPIDYLYGADGVQVYFGNEELAVATDGQIYLGYSTGTDLVDSPLHSATGNSNNAIPALAWSHDGSSIAFLVEAGQSSPGYRFNSPPTATFQDTLYVTAAQTRKTITLATNLSDAVALAWSSDDSKLVVLQETIGQHPVPPGSPGGLYFTPSLLIINVHNGTVLQQIHLPASNQTFIGECGGNCFPLGAHLQWATNGMIFISYDQSGNLLVTPKGKAMQVDSQQSDTLGAMDRQGTFIVYPISLANGQGSLVMVPISADGTLGTSTTLTTSASAEFSAVAISPDGTNIAACSDSSGGSSVIVFNRQNSSQVQTLLTMPIGSDYSQLSCQNLRWTADGQSLLVQVLGVDTDASGLVMVSSAGYISQVFFGCNVSYVPGTVSLQHSEGGGLCGVGKDDISAFTMQPVAPIATTTGTTAGSNDSHLLAQNPSVTVQPGQRFPLYFDFQNSGKSTWTDSGGYTLACDQFYMRTANCMQGAAQGLGGLAVAHGEQATFYVMLTAPSQPGTYQTSWDMRYHGQIFGKNHVYVTVNVVQSSQPLSDVDWANFTYSFSGCYGVQQFTTVNNKSEANNPSFTVDSTAFGNLADGQPVAVIIYTCAYGDAYSGVLVYTGTAEHPVLLSEPPLNNGDLNGLGDVYSARVVNGMLELTGMGYAPGDAQCCPSVPMTISEQWNGSKFVIVNTVSTPTS